MYVLGWEERSVAVREMVIHAVGHGVARDGDGSSTTPRSLCSVALLPFRGLPSSSSAWSRYSLSQHLIRAMPTTRPGALFPCHLQSFSQLALYFLFRLPDAVILLVLMRSPMYF